MLAGLTRSVLPLRGVQLGEGSWPSDKYLKQRLTAGSNMKHRDLTLEEKCAGAAPRRTDPVLSVTHRQILQTLSSVITLSPLAKRVVLCLPECDLGWESHENQLRLKFPVFLSHPCHTLPIDWGLLEQILDCGDGKQNLINCSN